MNVYLGCFQMVMHSMCPWTWPLSLCLNKIKVQNRWYCNFKPNGWITIYWDFCLGVAILTAIYFHTAQNVPNNKYVIHLKSNTLANWFSVLLHRSVCFVVLLYVCIFWHRWCSRAVVIVDHFAVEQIVRKAQFTANLCKKHRML